MQCSNLSPLSNQLFLIHLSFYQSITHIQQSNVSCQIYSLLPLSKYVYAMQHNTNDKNNNPYLLHSVSLNEIMEQHPFTLQNAEATLVQLEDKYCFLYSRCRGVLNNIYNLLWFLSSFCIILFRINDKIHSHIAQCSSQKALFDNTKYYLYCRYRPISSRLTVDMHVECIDATESIACVIFYILATLQ